MVQVCAVYTPFMTKGFESDFYFAPVDEFGIIHLNLMYKSSVLTNVVMPSLLNNEADQCLVEAQTMDAFQKHHDKFVSIPCQIIDGSQYKLGTTL